MKNETFELELTNFIYDSRSPFAYNFTICGIEAPWKFHTNDDIEFCTCIAIPRAAFTEFGQRTYSLVD